MKLFLTIQLIALLIGLFAHYWDVRKRKGYHSTDGGWTTTYTYCEKARQESKYMTYVAIALSIIGILILIWTLDV